MFLDPVQVREGVWPPVTEFALDLVRLVTILLHHREHVAKVALPGPATLGWVRGSPNPIVGAIVDVPIFRIGVALHCANERGQRDYCQRPKEGK